MTYPHTEENTSFSKQIGGGGGGGGVSKQIGGGGRGDGYAGKLF